MNTSVRNWLLCSASFVVIGGVLWWLRYTPELEFIGQMIFAAGFLALWFVADEWERKTNFDED